MFGKAFALVMLLSCVACAKPRWAPAEGANPQASLPENHEQQGGQDEQNAQVTCAATFKSGLCLAWDWEEQTEESDFRVIVFKTYHIVDGKAELADLSGTAALVLWMPSMGHGSSPTTVTRTAVGTYRATRVYFVMPGAWDLRFQNKRDNKVIDEAVVSITME